MCGCVASAVVVVSAAWASYNVSVWIKGWMAAVRIIGVIAMSCTCEI